MSSKPQPDKFLSYAEAAELIGVHVTTLKKGMCGTGTIPQIKLGGRVLFSFNAIQSWMAAKAREAEESERRQKLVVIDLLAEKSRRRRAVEATLKTIINGGRYK